MPWFRLTESLAQIIKKNLFKLCRNNLILLCWFFNYLQILRIIFFRILVILLFYSLFVFLFNLKIYQSQNIWGGFKTIPNDHEKRLGFLPSFILHNAVLGQPCFVIKRSPIWWSGPGHRKKGNFNVVLRYEA
ncbi:hypothetical protein BpHYR1_025151 [Brachionus plicatilis]|uniref:Uncharacterized protein n=1 Tax=Brachionus plicatilis TaxID=10195 RepID=A0A3M7RTY4_BRAPC|nr:hypothetical protein BpHYR1_025151 [Brachionus plicatilis]